LFIADWENEKKIVNSKKQTTTESNHAWSPFAKGEKEEK
jgi:hypothetical protein